MIRRRFICGDMTWRLLGDGDEVAHPSLVLYVCSPYVRGALCLCSLFLPGAHRARTQPQPHVLRAGGAVSPQYLPSSPQAYRRRLDRQSSPLPIY